MAWRGFSGAKLHRGQAGEGRGVSDTAAPAKRKRMAHEEGDSCAVRACRTLSVGVHLPPQASCPLQHYEQAAPEAAAVGG
jgi:hypothetical protein